MDIRVKVGRRILQMRRNREWRQTDLRERCEIGRGHLSELENGRREICLLMIEKLAKAFNVTSAELLK
ncbi:helix-turn-helix domain-containing protein [Terriglobus roseus]|uniref:Helix-turn-helix n=1 Tax=Terriglobus roseus TaxID=392734 RepID=A0A1H4NUS1_9BACT|nr:Helix-turn-helix [Terriglobus roseus]